MGEEDMGISHDKLVMLCTLGAMSSLVSAATLIPTLGVSE